MPGVGQLDSERLAMRRHVIHKLCIQPMAHSELLKALPDNVRLDELCTAISVICRKVSVASGLE